MGLDMYLTTNKYVGAWEHSNKNEKEAYKKILEVIGMKGVTCESSPHLMVEVTVGYWRKANSIHNWFVENCQDGIDECQKSDVSREQLQLLKETCEKVLESRGTEKEKETVEDFLPPTAGFFFGSTEVNEWYWQDVEHTISLINDLLNNPVLKDSYFIYQASW